MKGIYMSREDERVYNLAMEVIRRRLSIVEFSTLVLKSYRQCQRIIQKVEAKGMLGIKHGNLGKIPVNKTDSELEEDVISLLKNDYYDFNLTHFKEMLNIMKTDWCSQEVSTLRLELAIAFFDFARIILS